MTISLMFDVLSARREISRIILNYHNFDIKRKEIGTQLQWILKRHGHKQANKLVHELNLHEYNIDFVCPVVDHLRRIRTNTAAKT